jgi:hypothetical protein
MHCVQILREKFATAAAAPIHRLVLAMVMAASVASCLSLACAEEPKSDHLEFNPASFAANSNVIDNKWLPMKPGIRVTLDGFATEDGDQVRRNVVTTYTDLVKEIDGVRTAVLIEEDYNNKQLDERELAFHAQDKKGNIWHIGELVEHYEEHELRGIRVWFAGQPKGAKAGILMWAKPEVGTVASQGYAPPPYFWTDRGRVHQMGQKIKTATGNYDNVLVVEEWDDKETNGVFQLKYYAPGVGVVKIGFRGPDPEEEELELVKIEHLDATEMAKARQKALAMEERAYIYSNTKPMTEAAGQ